MACWPSEHAVATQRTTSTAGCLPQVLVQAHHQPHSCPILMLRLQVRTEVQAGQANGPYHDLPQNVGLDDLGQWPPYELDSHKPPSRPLLIQEGFPRAAWAAIGGIRTAQADLRPEQVLQPACSPLPSSWMYSCVSHSPRHGTFGAAGRDAPEGRGFASSTLGALAPQPICQAGSAANPTLLPSQRQLPFPLRAVAHPSQHLGLGRLR